MTNPAHSDDGDTLCSTCDRAVWRCRCEEDGDETVAASRDHDRSHFSDRAPSDADERAA